MKMPFVAKRCHVGIVRTDVSEDISASIFSVLFTAEAVNGPVIFYTLKMEATGSSERSPLSRPTRGHIPEHGVNISAKLRLVLALCSSIQSYKRAVTLNLFFGTKERCLAETICIYSNILGYICLQIQHSKQLR
jgi:hypothetical protein